MYGYYSRSTNKNNLSKLSLTDFVEVLSSKAPAPGGGGAAALTAAQGCALSAMVCNLTIGKNMLSLKKT